MKNEILEGDGDIVIILGKAYYNDGFFNIRMKHSELFGTDLSKIRIQLGENSTNIIEGYVNRTANVNGTPRIMAGISYTKWIKSNFRQGEIFKIKMINSQDVVLRK